MVNFAEKETLKPVFHEVISSMPGHRRGHDLPFTIHKDLPLELGLSLRWGHWATSSSDLPLQAADLRTVGPCSQAAEMSKEP